MILHPLITTISKPSKFTFPFCYTPHPLALQAAAEVQQLIIANKEWTDEVNKGKMFGVLVVEKKHQLYYLAAYSGVVCNQNNWDGFVPPIYNALPPYGFYKIRERRLNEYNHSIDILNNKREILMAEYQHKKEKADKYIQQYKQQMAEAKKRRDDYRRMLADKGKNIDINEAQLIHESQFMKAELRRIKHQWHKYLANDERIIADIDKAINEGKQNRKKLSDDTQRMLFSKYNLYNAKGHRRKLLDIFNDYAHRLPPSGAGDCCAPKLLQYAYKNRLHPVCMAEFWWGESPRNEIRKHLHYYPACRSKCLPILTFMLQGLQVEDNPLVDMNNTVPDIETVYEDQYIVVVNKPAGMLTVDGNTGNISLQSIMRKRYPDAQGPMIVHRLDMATSGLVVIAKDKHTHKQLQEMFTERTIKKRYIAILDGVVDTETIHQINLPICADLTDAPRQMVSEEYGKPAVTDIEVIKTEGRYTRVALYPRTGRTHQLRVHCAHPSGLNCAIKGDALYGKPSDRLYLHAEMISFVHPITHTPLTIISKVPF